MRYDKAWNREQKPHMFSLIKMEKSYKNKWIHRGRRWMVGPVHQGTQETSNGRNDCQWREVAPEIQQMPGVIPGEVEP